VVRAHIDDPSVYEPLWRHLSEYTALGAGDAADLCLFLEETGYAAAPGPFVATTAYMALTGDDENTGTVALVDDPTMPFVLELDVSTGSPWCSRARNSPSSTSPTSRPASSRPSTSPALVPARHGEARSHEVGCAAARGADYARWSDRAYASSAAELVGTARRIFDMALAYAKERKQFDVPIGSFQAIQHKLADMSLALERATPPCTTRR